MKRFIFAGGVFASLTVHAQDIKLSEYNWQVTDISQRNLTKEELYDRMDRNFIKVGKSICSNRALMWVYDFKRFFKLDAAKIFLFYTKKTGEVGRKTWWYHVSPVVNERQSLWVLDAGFPGFIDGPLTKEEWLFKFVGSNNCKEIKSTDTDLVERMNLGRVYPSRTSHGVYDCYYRLVPAGYWTPGDVAQNILGVDENGVSAPLVRNEISYDEVYTSCVEATTTSLGYLFGNNKDKCKKYLSR